MNKFLTGLGVGVAVGLLYAPRAGRESREQLRRQAEDWNEQGRNLGRRASDGVSSAREWAREARNRVQKAADQVVGSLRQASPGRQPNTEAENASRDPYRTEPPSGGTAYTGQVQGAAAPVSEYGSTDAGPAGYRASDRVSPDAGGDWLNALNTASREDLLGIYGVGPVLADQIVQNRPFRSESELTERGIVPESMINTLRNKLKTPAA